MFDQSNDAVRKYLRELDTELKRQGVAAADAARNDASEFLQGELLTMRKTGIELAGDELYDRFVERFGLPRVVAQGYAEPGESLLRRSRCGLAGRGHWKLAAAALLILAGTVGLCVAALNEPPKLSPFTEVCYEDEGEVIVRFRGKLFRLDAIDSIPTKSILQAARDQFGDRWQKRFAEDLVEVLWAMDHKPKRHVRLDLRDLKTNEAVTIEKAAMTEANRQQIWFARNGEAVLKLVLSAKSQEPPKLSPFTEVRYEGDDIAVVRVRGQLYRLLSLDGIPTKGILQAARDHFGELWQKRFAEDLVEVLWAMGHFPGDKVRLELSDPKSKKTLTIDVAMTEENRWQVWDARN